MKQDSRRGPRRDYHAAIGANHHQVQQVQQYLERYADAMVVFDDLVPAHEAGTLGCADSRRHAWGWRRLGYDIEFGIRNGSTATMTGAPLLGSG